MYLQQLITFLQVVKNKSFRRAAEHLCLTQPAISAQIRSLEEELGSPLFHRQPLSLTSGGEAFLPFAKQIVALAEESKRVVQDIEGLPQGNITVGASSGVVMAILPRLLKYFRDQDPRIQVTLHTQTRERILHELREGRLDVGITYHLEAVPRIETRVLFYDSLILIAPSDHPEAKLPVFPLERLAEIPLLSLTKETTERQLIDLHLRQLGISPRIQAELSGTEEIKRMVRLGFGFALIPRLAFEPGQDHSIRQLRVPGLSPQLPVTLLFPEGRYLSLALRQFIDDIRGIYPMEEN